MIHTMMPLYYCQALNQVFSNTVRGFGKSRAVMVLSLLGMIGCRQLWLAISMGINSSVTNIFIGYPVGWFFSAFFVFLYYWFAVRKKYKAAAVQQEWPPYRRPFCSLRQLIFFFHRRKSARVHNIYLVV